MRKTLVSIALLLLITGFAGVQSAHAQLFSDNFDSYTAGTDMHGQGGWKGWANDPNVGALVTNDYARSSPNSIEITGDSDLVHEFSDADQGVLTVTAWQYIPSDFDGETYFLLLNTYDDFGPWNWSTQLCFDNAGGDQGFLYSEWEFNFLPLIFDQWVEIRIVIDHDANTQDIYYGGQPLVTKSWTEGVSYGGAQNLAAIDLWSNASTPVYYDDITVEAAECEWIPETAWSDGTRYLQKGNWGTYTTWGPGVTATLYAGQSMEAGTVEFSAVDGNGDVTITITLEEGWRFADIEENIKIEGYASPPTRKPNLGKFTWKDYADTNPYSIVVDAAGYYGVHVDVEWEDCSAPE